MWAWISTLTPLNWTSTSATLSSALFDAGEQFGRVHLERDAGDDARDLLERGRDFVGAAVLILEAVLGLRLVGALVGSVGHAVVVVVGIGAAVVVLEVVLVLGLGRALVGGVGDAVAVVVGVGAAVLVLEAVLVLGIVRALVGIANDSVVVGIRAGRLRPSSLRPSSAPPFGPTRGKGSRGARYPALRCVMLLGTRYDAEVGAHAPAAARAVFAHRRPPNQTRPSPFGGARCRSYRSRGRAWRRRRS